MDYVDWCDALADGIAEYAERQHGRSVHLHQFADHLVASRHLSGGAVVERATILDAAEVLSACGQSVRSPHVQLKHGDLHRL